MFNIYDYKNKTTLLLDSPALQKYIFEKTKSHLINKTVTAERTGTRPTFISHYLNTLKNGILLKGIFLVTAVSKINNDVNTRFLLIATGNKYDYEDLIPKLNSQIPFIHIDYSAFQATHQGGYLSSWFRNEMGAGFSFIDVDFIFLKKDKVVLIEEKTFLGTMGYGQNLSYNELLSDIFSVKTIMCLLKVTGNSVNFQTKLKGEKFTNPQTMDIKDFINCLDI